MATGKSRQQKKQPTDQVLIELKQVLKKTVANNREIQRLLQEMADDMSKPSSPGHGSQKS